ncbi:hypothetical protein DPMN_011364 [Dreissena polymorpha]|uniref:Uncharacterized protein n=1 Tax=Dreissena polymorpha TaxID=45954 RepID=A0A9D4N3T4_DREPO|nr:hypothetical protein DPMN_011364 [Dreissena polymorpha]
MTQKNTLPPPEGKHNDILCNHVVYNRTSFRKYMRNDTFYVGILREPYEYFKSVLNYLRPDYIFKKINTSLPVSEYLKDPRKYEPKSPAMSFTNNRLAFEFGCTADVIDSSDAKQIIQFVKSVDSDFGLVIITELFEESIVLLRRYLNWSTKDVIYLDKNIAKNKNTTSFVDPFDRQLYKRWAKVDYALYEYFYRRLRDQIRREGDDFDEELLHFAENRKMASEFCSAGETNKKSNSKLIVYKSKWSDGFERTSSDCDLLRKKEIPFVQDIRFRQYGTRDI